MKRITNPECFREGETLKVSKLRVCFFGGSIALVRPPFPPSGKILTPFLFSFSIRLISKIHHVVAVILRNYNLICVGSDLVGFSVLVSVFF